MSAVDYSSDAENVLKRFYRANIVLYVEGEDDVIFWSKVFGFFSSLKVKIIPVGGSKVLDEKIQRIIDEDLQSLAARDSDYLRLCGEVVGDDRILYTFGYSIENSLYNPLSVASIIATLARSQDFPVDCVDMWFEKFFSDCLPYLHMDIANYIFSLGVGFPDNCSGFLANKKSHSIDAGKLEAYLVNLLGRELSDEEISEVVRITEAVGGASSVIYRGHFLQSAVHAYISKEVSLIKSSARCSYDAMYLGAVHCLKDFFENQTTHSDHYRVAVQRASVWGEENLGC